VPGKTDGGLLPLPVLGSLLPGLGGQQPNQSATGLTEQQENSMLSQLLGGLLQP
jgi:hypothetical protein